MIIKRFELLLFLARLDAGRTQMVTGEFHITQGAQKATTIFTRNNRLLRGVIKTTGLAVHEQDLAGLSRTRAVEEGGEHMGPQGDSTGRTPREVGSITNGPRQ